MKRALALGAVLLALAWPRATDGCGPELPDAIFVRTRTPDRPLEFAAGRLGVLQPTYYQAYLVAAYRSLRGLGLAPGERLAVLGFPDSTAPAPPSADGAYWGWVEQRRAYPGADSATGFSVFRALPDTSSSYLSVDYTNCLAGAFTTAGRTLVERAKRYGPNSPWLGEWLRGQDRVFANCSSVALMPEPVPASAPPLARADRDYQIAAAFFYGGHFERAAEKFDAIARDSQSPWRTLAPYLAARAYTRQGTLTLGSREIDRAALLEAERRATRVLASSALRSTHDDTRRLLGFLRFRLYPEARLRELSRALAAPRPSASLRQDASDFTWLLDRFTQARVESLATTHADYDLADWVLTFQTGGPSVRTHAIQRWQKTHSVPWLVAAVRHARGDDPEREGLLRACAETREDSPAFATLQVHRVRLLLESGRTDEARATLDRLLAGSRTPWPPSALNLLLAQRLRLARTLDEFVAFAPREPAEVTAGWVGSDRPDSGGVLLPRAFTGEGYLAGDGAWLLNRRLPLSEWIRLASTSRWPSNLRAEVATAAFVRALVLEQGDVARAIAPTVLTLLPQTRGNLERYLAATSEPARGFEAASFLLDFPGAMPAVPPGVGRVTPLDRLDTFRDNWWCATSWVNDPYPGLLARDVFGAPHWQQASDTLDAPWLGAEEREAARAEWQALTRAESGPNYICRRVVAWGRAHPDDPRVPRALHLAVQATRHGCHDAGTTALSKQAFRLLHARYPKSEWAQKTPHYY